MWALTLPSLANYTASASSLRLPKIDLRIVIRFSTTSKIGVGNLPGGRPFSATIFRPIALAYCTAIWPSPPMPEIASHSPGLASVSLMPL